MRAKGKGHLGVGRTIDMIYDSVEKTNFPELHKDCGEIYSPLHGVSDYEII